jgi:integrase
MAKRRRAAGEGSVFFWEAKGLWVGRITLPDGKKKTKYHKKQSVVKDWLLENRNQLRQGMLPSDDTVTLGEFLNNYMETVGKQILRPTTQKMYNSYIRVHIVPAIGRIKLKDLRPDHLQGFYNQKLSEGLSKRTVQIIHGIIRRVLNQAVEWQRIPRNVCSLVHAPRPDKKAAAFYTKEQLNTLLTAVRGQRFELIYILLVYGGFREGEVLGIHVEDCDLQNRAVNVQHQVVTVKGGMIISEPKTKTSRRVVTLPTMAYNALKVHLEQLQQKQGLIFTTSSGRPISPRNFIRHFKKTIKEAGLPDLTVHQIRHSHASLLLASGENPKLVQERLGHSTIGMTLDLYSHSIPGLQQGVAKRLDDLMG